MNTAEQDFTYYKRSLIQMYQVYFRRRILVIATAMLIIIGYLLLMQEGYLINGLLLVLLSALEGWLFKRYQAADQVIDMYLKDNTPPKVLQLTEFEDVYAFEQEDGTIGRIKKRGNRNFPSNDKRLTLMAGYQKGYFLKQPFVLLYYDMLATKFDEAYRLKRNRQNGFQRWSHLFSFRSFRDSIGNGFRFLLGNLFFLFIIYRLIRYVIQILQVMF